MCDIHSHIKDSRSLSMRAEGQGHVLPRLPTCIISRPQYSCMNVRVAGSRGLVMCIYLRNISITRLGPFTRPIWRNYDTSDFSHISIPKFVVCGSLATFCGSRLYSLRSTHWYPSHLQHANGSQITRGRPPSPLCGGPSRNPS